MSSVPRCPSQDVVIGNGNSGANELYRNDGGGTFTAITSTPITAGSSITRALAWGDMDGDGDLVRRWLSRARAWRPAHAIARRLRA